MVGCERLPLLERSDQKLGADLGLSDNAIRKRNTSVTVDVQSTYQSTTNGWGEEKGEEDEGQC